MYLWSGLQHMNQTSMIADETPGDRWNPALYVERHSFVYELGQELIEVVNVQPGERILDIGCGTGQLTAQLAERGADVLGIDISPAMIEEAKNAYPDLAFEVGDASRLEIRQSFDVVFSNATLHWVTPAHDAAQRMADALKSGGRIVAEFGGSGNVRLIRAAICQALEDMGLGQEKFENPWFNPTIAEYVMILSHADLDVTFAHLFERPTPLEGTDGLHNWLEMFTRPYLVDLKPEVVHTVLKRAVEVARDDLFVDGSWYADYVRLRITARTRLLQSQGDDGLSRPV